MQPLIQLNYSAILIATFGSFFLGFIWYSFLFNKIWMKEMGVGGPKRPAAKQMIGIMLTNFAATFLMAWVFAHNQQAWDARSWGHAGNFVTDYAAAAMGAIFTWIGFYLPQDLNKILFQNRTWKVAAIDTLFNLCSLLITAFALAMLK